MLSQKRYFLIPSAFLSGLFGGLFFLILLPKFPLAVDYQLYSLFGIKKPQIVGFQPFWLLSRADKPYQKYITTFTYFGLTLDRDGKTIQLVSLQEEEPGWTTLKTDRLQEKLQQAKKDCLKLSLLIHNSNEASISALLKEPEKHAQKLIADINPLMKKYGFTDLNLDIESFKEASESAQQEFTTFVKEVKKGVDENNLGTLTVEINPTALIKPRLINAREIGQIADYIILMTYDFHYINSFLAGPVAPIGGVGEVREFDVETALKEALNIIQAEKIILGIPLYGYEWETLSYTPGAPTIPGGGSTASNQRVTEFLASCDQCTEGFDEQSRQAYLIFPDEDYFHQIFYEDEKSIKEKLALAKEHKIAGVALWALGYEGDKILNPLEAYKNSFNFDPSLRIIN